MSFSSNEMDDIISDFIVEATESLDSLDQKFVELEKNPGDTTLLNDIFRSVHTIKGAAGFLGFTQMVEMAHATEDVLNRLRKGDMVVVPAIMDAILLSIDIIKQLLRNIRDKNDRQENISGAIAALNDILDASGRKAGGAASQSEASLASPAAMKPQPDITEHIRDSSVDDWAQSAFTNLTASGDEPFSAPSVVHADEEDVHAGVSPQAAEDVARPQEASVKEREQSIRVDIDRLDSVLNLAGELVLSRNRLMRLGVKMGEEYMESELSVQVEEAIGQLDLVTTDLQLAIMKMRMQPIAKVFNKFPRMVRDLARQNNKEIDLVVSGEETEVDKTVIEEIGDPLVHLIRNSVDHGLETPDEREAAGKPRTGAIKLVSYQEGRHIIVSVSDDGKGMDPDIIRKAAVDKGVITADDAAALSPKESLGLIFLPGFSTAKEVSNISGRGVGMDVVKTNITRINGTINVESEPGRFTRVTFRLPLTLAIIQALTVEAAGEVYGIPLSTVIENIRVTDSDIKTVRGKEVIHIRERVYPVIRLESLVSRSAPVNRNEWRYIVITGIGERSFGLLVDKLHGQEEIVMKSMGEYLKGTEGIAGACITGDGNVILILDVAGLLETAHRTHV
ncbi:MAG: chemotaxis protein CheA [Deltaproteobacteria bacterium]|nr:chemotaxis protein CheA [Deltaproteobacteria bacterium]